MRRNTGLVIAMILVMVGSVWADLSKGPASKMTPMRGGSNDPSITARWIEPDPRDNGSARLDTIGTIYPAGLTWFDQQHNGTIGKMITVDESGYVHVLWMKGQTSDNDNGPRHVYYNIWDPATSSFQFLSAGQPAGQVVDASSRAGYACMAGLPSGWVFPSFHQEISNLAHTGAAIDLMPGMGIFNTTMPDYIYENGTAMEIIWPKIAVGGDSTIHVVSTENPANGQLGAWQRIYYSRGHPEWDTDGMGVQVNWDAVEGVAEFKMIDTVMVIAPMIAASAISDRVVIAWSQPRSENIQIDSLRTQHDNDLYIIVSEDGGYNWGAMQNVTDFAYADEDCPGGDTLACDRDTFRLYTDCDVILDASDNIHVAFTTKHYFSLEGTISRTFSEIWHWSDNTDVFSNITKGEFGINWEDSTWNSPWMDAGAWQLMVQRPSLSLDPVTGYLYCSYQRYDTMQISEAGFPMAEIYVAVSTDNGCLWSAGVDVTNTIAGLEIPAGQCMHERDVSIANRVTYSNGQGYIDMFYVLDGDAGTPLQDEGTVTLNPALYQRIPISQIPSTPVNPWFAMNLHADSSHYPPCALAIGPDQPNRLPESFTLYQNYPNPFNPATTIQFDLSRNAKVTLKVFNVVGQEVATLFDGATLTAGVQTVAFDGSSMASGIYLYRLEVDGITSARKMVLMK